MFEKQPYSRLSAKYCSLTQILDDIYTLSYEAHKSGQLMGINRDAGEAQCDEVTTPMNDDASPVGVDVQGNKEHTHDDDSTIKKMMTLEEFPKCVSVKNDDKDVPVKCTDCTGTFRLESDLKKNAMQ